MAGKTKKVSKRYFILGPKASIFYCPKTTLKVLSTDKENPDVLEGVDSAAIKIALSNNHIQEIDAPVPASTGKAKAPADDEDEDDEEEEEEDDATGTEETEESLSKMDDDQLLAYYEKNFEATAKDVKKFKALDKAAKVKFLLED